jgi:hypothetical protein
MSPLATKRPLLTKASMRRSNKSCPTCLSGKSAPSDSSTLQNTIATFLQRRLVVARYATTASSTCESVAMSPHLYPPRLMLANSDRCQPVTVGAKVLCRLWPFHGFEVAPGIKHCPIYFLQNHADGFFLAKAATRAATRQQQSEVCRGTLESHLSKVSIRSGCRAGFRASKAPEDWRTPRRFAFAVRSVPRASVLECGGPPPLFPPRDESSIVSKPPRTQPDFPMRPSPATTAKAGPHLLPLCHPILTRRLTTSPKNLNLTANAGS